MQAAFLALLVLAAVALGAWSLGPPLPTARTEVAVATVGSRIYVIGGSGSGNVDQAVNEEYDTATQKWRERARIPQGMNHIGAVGYAGKVYTFGGFDQLDQSPVADAYVYNPPTNRWSAIAPLPTALGSASVAVLQGKIHIVGGRGTESVTTHFIYDPATNTYRIAAPLPHPRDHMVLVAAAGKLFAIGGRLHTFAHNTAYNEVYDPANDRWQEMEPLTH